MVPPPPLFSGTSPFSPTSRHGQVSLPDPVEYMIARICTEKLVLPPDYLARKELDRLGEFVSLNILGVIASSRVRNFSGFIMHLAKNSPIAMARNAEGSSTSQSDCFSAPPVGDTSSVEWEMVERESIRFDQEMATPDRIVNSPPTVSKQLLHFGANSMENDNMVHRRLDMEMDQARLQNYDNHCHSSIPQRVRHLCQRVISPQMKTLGDFEFRRRFLILSYLGRAKLEDAVSMELLGILNCMPMEAFEFQIWKEFGMKNIKPSDRRKILDWDMGKTHVYHCHVDLQGKATFKGPFLESTKTHLQRVLGDENILQVKFEEVSQEKKTKYDFDNYYCDVYHRVAEQGIEIGLRQYQFLLYKDGGKEEKKKSGTKSSVKCYFVCTASGWDRDRNNDFLYGKTDGSTVLKGIHTDGTGFISEDLALQCPIYVSKGNIQPLLMQVRLFYKGLCAKGTLLVNRLLPKKTIQIRPSMIKVQPDPSVWGIVQPFNSLEVVNTSTRPKKVHLSRYLISLLHVGGVPTEFFLGLLSSALAEAESCRYDRGAALKAALNNEGLDNDRLTARMIYSGMPLDEPFLQYRLGLMMGEERKGLQAGRIPISDSYYLMGTTDPTGKLLANQVCVILDKGQLSGNILVYKHPGLHPGDIHLLQATFVKGLERVVGDSKYAIFFPVVGPRSLADEMANSDFDGDIYWVSRHPELLKNFKPNPPWLVPEEDLSKKGAEDRSLANINSYQELERSLFHSFLNNRFKPR
ncbi:putative RNA-dependent RNA polymerase 5 isoform X1 [Carex littledalei]|uniref:RNA-dependent RNA polymerase n=1 Tax=Carex littledalei TaxID=544730 RepID=A0A833V1Q0_9POAL|nr:putative RNA-dependent RNA polymerase 5 isoform X1 [Carex littledalei]